MSSSLSETFYKQQQMIIWTPASYLWNFRGKAKAIPEVWGEISAPMKFVPKFPSTAVVQEVPHAIS